MKRDEVTEWSIGRFFDHLCGRVAIDGKERKSYWIGEILAAKANYETGVHTLMLFMDEDIVEGARPVVETLLERIYRELGE